MTHDEAVTNYRNANHVAQAADDHLSTLLHKAYGRAAGDMRYRAAQTPEIAEAMRAYQLASEARYSAWLLTLETEAA